MDFINRPIDAAIQIGIALVIAVAGFFITKLLVHLVEKALKKTSMDDSLILFFKRVTRIVFYCVFAIAVLTQLGVNPTGLIASFSAALVACALALKDNLSDVASGIIILFTKPFVTGDFIVFGEHQGYVQKIDLMHTIILTYDDTDVVIPNRMLTTQQINNYTAHPEYRVQVFIPISYETDLDRAKEIILDTMLHADKVILDNEKFTPKVRLEHFQESSLEIIARCYVNFKDYWPVYYYLTENIKKNLEKEGILIPFNQLDVHLK